MDNLEAILSSQDIESIKTCGRQMDAATNGAITISDMERTPLPSRSPAVLDSHKDIEKESERGI